MFNLKLAYETSTEIFVDMQFQIIYPMKCKCFVDRFISANCSIKRLALSGKVIVKLIISGKQFNYWQRHQIFGVVKHH